MTGSKRVELLWLCQHRCECGDLRSQIGGSVAGNPVRDIEDWWLCVGDRRDCLVPEDILPELERYEYRLLGEDFLSVFRT